MLKAGDVVKVKKEHRKAVRGLVESIHAAEAGIAETTRNLKDAQKELFRSLNAMYPELKPFHYTVQGSSEVTIRREKTEFEKDCDAKREKEDKEVAE